MTTRIELQAQTLYVDIPNEVRVGERLPISGTVIVQAIWAELVDAGKGSVLPGEVTVRLLPLRVALGGTLA